MAEATAPRLAALTSPGSRVGIACRSRARFVATVAAARAAGMVAVPLSERPPTDEFERGRWFDRLADAAPAVVAVDELHRPLLGDRGFERASVDAPVPTELWVGRAGTTTAAGKAAPADLAAIVYTSGSSGRPKGAMITAGNMTAIDATNAGLYRWRSDDRFLSTMPMTHLAGLTNVLSALGAGVDVVVGPSVAFVDELRDVIERERVTVAGMVPHQLARLFEQPRQGNADRLRLIVSSGAPLSDAVAARVIDARPEIELWNAYGLTEAFRSLVSLVSGVSRTDRGTPCSAATGSTATAESTAALIGRPVAGVEVRLRPRSRAAGEAATIGELQLRGKNVFAGYWGHDARPAEQWFDTGDLASIDHHGSFRLIGRRTTFVNIGGEKAPIEAIESVIDGLAPDRIAAATTVDAQGFEQVVAVVEESVTVSAVELRRHVGRRLAASLRPRTVIVVDQLPRHRNGKLDRQALKRRVDAARPSSVDSPSSASHQPTSHLPAGPETTGRTTN